LAGKAPILGTTASTSFPWLTAVAFSGVISPTPRRLPPNLCDEESSTRLSRPAERPDTGVAVSLSMRTERWRTCRSSPILRKCRTTANPETRPYQQVFARPPPQFSYSRRQSELRSPRSAYARQSERRDARASYILPTDDFLGGVAQARIWPAGKGAGDNRSRRAAAIEDKHARYAWLIHPGRLHKIRR
jgi:hypothetical protein